MDVILKVLDGAKVGTKIAVKKDKFLIGRSPKCHLCAGHNSISRKHCAIIRHDASVTIMDLGSRNGTLVNEKKIEPEKEFELSSGDEITVGSLRFMLTISHGIKNQKRPKVKSVAEAVERTAQATEGNIDEEDISKWLIDEPGISPQAFNETQTIQMDETNALGLAKSIAEEQAKEKTEETNESEEEEAEVDEESKKKEPGKLPPIPKEPASKDSSEAAMQALRNWNRRR